MSPTRTRILPPDRQVDCACDPGLQRAVLHDQTGHNVRVTACMHCGAVTATRSLVEEPRPHDVRCVGNEIITLEPDAHAWLARWPRRAGAMWGGPAWCFIPAEVRCDSTDALRDREQRIAAAADGVPLRIERLRAAGVPVDPAPSTLPDEFASFPDHHAALALARDASADVLMRTLAQAPSASALLTELLATRADADQALADALRSRDPAPGRAAVTALVSMPALAGPAVLGALRARLDVLQSERDESASALVYTTGALGLRAGVLLPTLEALGARIDPQREYYFHRAVAQVIARVRG